MKHPDKRTVNVTANKHEEEVLLDVNKLTQKQSFFSIGTLATSFDQRMLAYSFDTEGNEVYTLRFKDLQTKQLLNESLTVKVVFDNSCFFFF